MFPTGFTPTLEENKFFRPKVRGIAEMEILIFNLWGNMLFRTNDLKTEGWDGKVNGEDAPIGSYTYVILLEVSVNGKLTTAEDKGVFALLR